MGDNDTSNPCTGLCRFDAAGTCRGCLRSKAEAKGWKRLPDSEKAAINRRIRDRVAATAPPGTGAGKTAAKRLRKLDKKIRKLEARLAALRRERETAGAGGAAVPREEQVSG
ncbi:DUF1289 domain-containing protein [Azospirillum picis]|uniref:Fe-S protein YdhL (DUF1289 family) n=1 Tax=Azospirillum picis TaxID=488438 RepID=A0ABU0MNI7_9PROT|nr:DUF1289 domain-containing protein [Azospirillum picis]MBP2300799.1 putative Fe-S protein YdhL (DUF1289 family) [Azospirillum picis]MDQ0534768.1 putative Fe-S protein YdhL (DUF1289 family) [Azospirillum picis]